MISLADLRTAQNDFLGTSELNLYTEPRRIAAINRAIRYILKHYDINEYTQKVTVTPDSNGNFDVADDFLRSAKLYRDQFWEYMQVDFDRFEYQIPNTYTILFDSTTDQRFCKVYPVVSPMYFWYIQLAPALEDEDDEVRFQIYWEEAIAAKSVEYLMRGSRLTGAAMDMKNLADEYIADAWQSDRSYLQGKEDQRLQSVYEKKSLLWAWDGIFSPYTQTAVPSCLTWIEINSDATAQANYGYIVDSASLVIVTLPSDPSLGDTIQITQYQTGNWRIAQNAGDQIIFGNQVTTQGTGGYLQSTATGDALTLVFTGNNKVWTVAPGSQGNITIV